MAGQERAAYLNELASRLKLRSADVGAKLEGSSPPSVFIGKFGYPKVFAGPMLTQQTGDTSILDSPEEWIPAGLTTEKIAELRIQLVRGKELVGIRDFKNKTVQKVQEVALAKKSVYSDVEFTKKPHGISFSFDDSHQPFGPSAPLKNFEKENSRFEPHLEKAYYDIDLKAVNAVTELYNKGLQFTQIQKAFSVGAFGREKNRRLVPTRWSITAVDDILGKYLVRKVKENPLIDNYCVYEFSALNNYFAVMFAPTIWQYEWTEAFIHILGNEEMIFSDWEPATGKKEYSPVGGCFYSVRFAVAEKLAAIGRQASAIVFREAYPGYIPLGVFACREITRNALKQQPKEFTDLKSALTYINSKLQLGMDRFRQESTLLQGLNLQTSLAKFF
ncbi:MAG: hypothetical protein HY438_00420 [DPANN group archaeon]|nr:hypothetical protein [DPANN group archaeon]